MTIETHGNTAGGHRNCPVCDGANSASHWQKGDLRIVRCTVCGMVYAKPAPAGMASGEYYDKEAAAYYLSPAKLASDYAAVRFQRELKLFRAFCPRGAVLDVGCGSGAFLFQLQQRWPGDYQVLGTDVSGAPLDYAESRGVPVARGNFLDLDVGGRKFDAITLWAVAEHLAEPRAFLERVHTLLRPGGVSFVLVPNMNSLATKLLGKKYRYVYPQHLNYFSATTLARLLTECELTVTARRFSHFNPAVIWQDFRRGGREVSNAERGELLQRTTRLKQTPWLRPAKWAYQLAEKSLCSLGWADNVVLVARREA